MQWNILMLHKKIVSVRHVEWQIGVVSAFVPRRRSPVIGRRSRHIQPCDCILTTVYVNAVCSPGSDEKIKVKVIDLDSISCLVEPLLLKYYKLY